MAIQTGESMTITGIDFGIFDPNQTMIRQIVKMEKENIYSADHFCDWLLMVDEDCLPHQECAEAVKIIEEMEGDGRLHGHIKDQSPPWYILEKMADVFFARKNENK